MVKHCRPGSSLIWVHTVCLHTYVNNVSKICAADNLSRQHFQMDFCNTLRIKKDYAEVQARVSTSCFYIVNEFLIRRLLWALT